MNFGLSLVVFFGFIIHGAETMAGEVTPRDPIKIPQQTKPGKCANCHGYFGISESELIPNLAGQKNLYLKNQLILFRAKKKSYHVGTEAMRHNDLMTLEATSLDDSEIDDLASYFAQQSCQSKPPPSQVRVTKKIHRCAVCHGWLGISKMSMVPNLAGQKKPYLAKQLELFRSSSTTKRQRVSREFRYHGAMARYALPMLLTDAEIDSLAGYFSAQNCKGRWKTTPPRDLFHGQDKMAKKNTMKEESNPVSKVNAANLGSEKKLISFNTAAGRKDEEVDGQELGLDGFLKLDQSPKLNGMPESDVAW